MFTRTFAEVRSQYAIALATLPDIIEAVVLTGVTFSDIDQAFENFMTGRAFRGVDPTDDGVRERIEHAPLRKSYAMPETKTRFDTFSTEEIHGYTALMRRVMAGTLGGPNDGE